MSEELLNGAVTLHHGDSRDVLKCLPDESLDSCVCDPPYALVSIVKRFGGPCAAPTKDGDVYARSSAGFMNQAWDTGETAFAVEFWAEVMRVLKPGGHVLACGGTRTYHRLACAIEDAGFEIRDTILWLYGSGFPKSHDVSKGIDKAAGAERTEVIGKSARHGGGVVGNGTSYEISPEVPEILAPATPEAEQWQGWGTALKPACEPIVLARKPLGEKTVAANVLAHGTGALNVDGCRVEAEKPTGWGGNGGLGYHGGCDPDGGEARPAEGRWPANVVHDGSEEVVAGFPDSDGQQGDLRGHASQRPTKTCFGDMGPAVDHPARNDSGSAARFFYSAKADAMDRIGSKHPTVKPVDLMQWLCRLVTPPGGVILDPFAGSGTTGEAAFREGFKCILIEREADYCVDIRERMNLATSGEKSKRRAIAKRKDEEAPAGGLFG
jgi:DNA modification methylase